MCTPAGDLERFALALLRDPGEMAIPAQGTGGGVGLGLAIRTLSDGTTVIGHAGANPGWKADLKVFPERDWGVVVLTNGDNGKVLNEVLRLVA